MSPGNFWISVPNKIHLTLGWLKQTPLFQVIVQNKKLLLGLKFFIFLSLKPRICNTHSASTMQDPFYNPALQRHKTIKTTPVDRAYMFWCTVPGCWLTLLVWDVAVEARVRVRWYSWKCIRQLKALKWGQLSTMGAWEWLKQMRVLALCYVYPCSMYEMLTSVMPHILLC